MSDYKTQDNQTDYIAPLGLVRLVLNWLGAIASIALVVGLVTWVFQLGTRNPNEIPIIRAMKGPARVQPNNPGGVQARHQGLAVNAVQSDGTAQKPAQTVILAPRQKPLSPEDAPQSELAKISPVLRPKLTQITSAQIPPRPAVESAIVKAVKAPPPPTVQDPSLITESIVTEQQSRVIASSKYAPLKSLVPHLRPGNLIASIQTATEVAARPTQEPATSVPLGTRLVQFGAYDKIAVAKSEWSKLIRKHGDLLAGKTRLIQAATSGGRKFYRLRARGFGSAEESRNLCSALLARGTACIPVVAR